MSSGNHKNKNNVKNNRPKTAKEAIRQQKGENVNHIEKIKNKNYNKTKKNDIIESSTEKENVKVMEEKAKEQETKVIAEEKKESKTADNTEKKTEKSNVREFRRVPDKDKLEELAKKEQEKMQKKMKVNTKVIRTYEEKETFAQKLENKYGIRLNVNMFVMAKIGIIALVTIIFVCYLAYITRILEVEVDNSEILHHYTDEEIKDFVIKDELFDHNAILLFLKYRYTVQEDIPFVEKIDVDLINKNKIKITAYGKKIIGCTEYMNQYLYFDKDGIFVEASDDIKDDTAFITGINFKEVTLYEKMKVDNDNLFNLIIGITQQISLYKLDVEEINFDKNYNVTLYCGDVTVEMGKYDNYDDQLALLKNILTEAEANNMKGVLHLENFNKDQKKFIFDSENDEGVKEIEADTEADTENDTE
ncbi:MAG: hypothetical protein K6G26_10920 [Lachnospiraceae bacterium]|nr:hypothetical protein [Lachnospiraceae bacterium]